MMMPLTWQALGQAAELLYSRKLPWQCIITVQHIDLIFQFFSMKNCGIQEY